MPYDVDKLRSSPKFQALPPKLQSVALDKALRENARSAGLLTEGQGRYTPAEVAQLERASGAMGDVGTFAPPAGLREMVGSLLAPVGLAGLVEGSPKDIATMGSFAAGDVARAAAHALPGGYGKAVDIATLAVPPLVRAGAAALEAPPGERAGAAVRGGIEGAAMTGLAAVPAFAARKYGEYKVRAKDLENIVGTLKTNVPSIAGSLKAKGQQAVAAIESLFRGGEGEARVSGALNRVKNRIDGLMGGSEFDLAAPTRQRGLASRVPVAPARGTFRQFDEEITEMNNRGWDMSGDPSTRSAGKEMRRKAEETTRELTQYIKSTLGKGAAKAYKAARQEYNQYKLMERVFSTPGVIDEGRVNMSQIHDMLFDNPDLRRQIGSSPAGRRFLRTVFRGQPLVARDVQGKFRPIAAARTILHPTYAHDFMQLPRSVGPASAPVPRTAFAIPEYLIGRRLADYLANPSGQQ